MFAIGVDRLPVTFAAGAALSPYIALGTKVLVGISMPLIWTAAALTFQESIDGVSFQELYNIGGGETTIDVAANVFVQIDPNIWHGVQGLFIRSGTLAAPVVQPVTTTLTLVLRSNIT